MDTDIAVIGGGPAGSTAATLLARAGFEVTVFEKARFPRPHVGESLLPATLAILDDVGVLPAVEREGFVKKQGATMCWGRTDEPWSWYFRETNRRFPHAYQVWRPRFDQILLDHSKACGATVHEGLGVRDVAFEQERAIGVVLDDGTSVSARLVIDASGQASLIARKLDLKVWDAEFRNLAVYGYFADCPHLAAPDDGNILIESCRDGWLWKIPLAGDLASIGAVVDRDFGARAVRERGLTPFLLDQIAASKAIASLIGNRQPIEAPVAVRDWSYATKRMAGPGFVLIGDAACFVDPLFSTGVHLAVSAAHIGAAYATSALTEPDIANEAAQAFERLYRTQYEHFHELARLFYAGNRSVDSYFWEARRITGERIAPREAFVRAVSGQAAAGYERSVLSHGALPDAFREVAAAVRPVDAPNDVGNLRPTLASGLELVRTAVLGDGRFERGYAVRGANRVDLPVSPLVAHLVDQVSRNSERRTTSELAEAIATGNDAPPSKVVPPLLEAARLLVRDRVFMA